MKFPPDYKFPSGTKSLGVNLDLLFPPRAPAVAAPAAVDAPAAKPSKYGNRRTEYDGRVYDSKAEALRAEELDRMVAAGEILEWIPQPTFRLSDARIGYRADFLVVGLDSTWVEDRKGVPTEKFATVVKLWRAYGRLPLHVIYEDCTEIIIPERRAA